MTLCRSGIVVAALCAASGLGAQVLDPGPVAVSPDQRTIAAQPANDLGVPSSRVNVIALLSDPPLARALAAARPAGAPRKSVSWTAAQQAAYVRSLQLKQAAIIGAASELGATVLGQLTKATNGVMFSIDSSRVPGLSSIAGVSAVLSISDPERSATVPDTAAYIGATNLHSRNPAINGSGIRIAVIDSGIDFTHKNLGGAGTVSAYRAAYGVTTGCASTPQNTSLPAFTSKVVGGFDFVGESWPNGPLAPDPNPIDCEGHGTSVSDIVAGKSADGTWKGVAPEAQLYAVKVCSAVSTSCSGVALLLGFDFALDPNGDSDLSDAVDVMNLSLGSPYGMREAADSFAAQNASFLASWW